MCKDMDTTGEMRLAKESDKYSKVNYQSNLIKDE